jgi:hypothetical protein
MRAESRDDGRQNRLQSATICLLVVEWVMTCLRVLIVLLMLLTLVGHPVAQEKVRAENRGRAADPENAWADLDSSEASVRDAARKIIEAQPFHTWKSRAIGETRPWASIEALLALCHACPLSEGAVLRPHLCEGITTLRIEQMTGEQLLAALRLTRLVCTRFGQPTEDERQQMIDLWSRFLPPPPENKQTPEQRGITRELRELLSLLGSVAGQKHCPDVSSIVP